jgi:histidine triad (HIT) family protein
MEHSSSDCIFCKIIQGEIPCSKVFENEHVFAFLDISQASKGHTLIVPKIHKENVYELTPDIATEIFKVVPKISNSIKKQFSPIGLNLLSNNGEHAGQSVFHFHLHLIPRYGKGDGFGAVWKSHAKDYSPAKLNEIASTISTGLE